MSAGRRIEREIYMFAELELALASLMLSLEGEKITQIFFVDRNNSKVMMMISAAGGMDIEEVAITNPEQIINVHFTTYKDISLDDSLLTKLDITKNQLDELTSIINKLLDCNQNLIAIGVSKWSRIIF